MPERHAFAVRSPASPNAPPGVYSPTKNHTKPALAPFVCTPRIAHGKPPCNRLARRRCRVHRISSRVRDDHDTPLLPGETGGVVKVICPTPKQKFCPTGQFVAGPARQFVATIKAEADKPDDWQNDAVLAAVKAWSGNSGVRGDIGATTILDGVCARRRREGRSGRRNGAPVEQRNRDYPVIIAS